MCTETRGGVWRVLPLVQREVMSFVDETRIVYWLIHFVGDWRRTSFLTLFARREVVPHSEWSRPRRKVR